MKKSLSLVLILLVSTLWSCSKIDSGDDSSANEKQSLIQDTNSETTVSLDYSNDIYKSLTIPQALILKERFLATEKLLREKGLKGEDTESIYYTLDELKNIVWYIEYHTRATGLKIDPKTLGVNIHFGRYPDASELGNFPLTPDQIKNYAGKQTIFFVPTVQIDGKRVEFNPKKNHLEIVNGKSKSIKSLIEHHKSDLQHFKLVDYEEDSPVPDFGKLEPPYHN